MNKALFKSLLIAAHYEPHIVDWFENSMTEAPEYIRVGLRDLIVRRLQANVAYWIVGSEIDGIVKLVLNRRAENMRSVYQVVKIKYDENGAYLEVSYSNDANEALEILTAMPNNTPAVIFTEGGIFRSRSVKVTSKP